MGLVAPGTARDGRTIRLVSLVLAVASFLLGAALSAFLAAWFVRRSATPTAPGLAPVGSTGQPAGSVELAYFGLLPGFSALGLGGWLLHEVVAQAWALPGTNRVWPWCRLFHHSTEK